MSIPYDWRCKFCLGLNQRGTHQCISCGREAIATSREVDTVPNDIRGAGKQTSPAAKLSRPSFLGGLVGIVGGIVALIGLMGIIGSWGHSSGFFATFLGGITLLGTTAIMGSVSKASIGIVITLAIFRWIIVIPLLGSMAVVIADGIHGRLSREGAIWAAFCLGSVSLLLVPELRWLLNKAWQKAQVAHDA
jgi:hypothetical protein